MLTPTKNLVRVCRLGRLGFSQALKVQLALAAQHKADDNTNCDTLLLVEHTPVYTIGIRKQNYTDEDVTRLQKTGAEFYQTNRGGLITFHGPGQLVVYPIINLKHFKTSMKWYICSIEKTVIDLCSKFNLKAGTSPHTGVWVGDNKICAIGVHGSRYVTTHGLALNCNVDLGWYKHIVPCGIEDKGVTSLSVELGREVTIDEAIPVFLDSFGRVFNCECIEAQDDEKRTLGKC